MTVRYRERPYPVTVSVSAYMAAHERRIGTDLLVTPQHPHPEDAQLAAFMCAVHRGLDAESEPALSFVSEEGCDTLQQ